MNHFTCAQARDFRALLGRCSTGRPRGPAPPVVVRGGPESGLFARTAEGVTLALAMPVELSSESLVLPGSVLAEVEGDSDEPVALERSSPERAIVRWKAPGHLRSLPVELLAPGPEHAVPATPPLVPVDPELLTALHECGRGVARERIGRYDLTRLQVQGKAGCVIGTDSKVALICRGFAFPFAESVLVPAVPVFGSKPLAAASEVRVGRSDTHLVIAAGPWTIGLPIDTVARYPDVVLAIPDAAGATTVGLDERDLPALRAALARLPGADDDNQPITLDLAPGVVVRGRDSTAGTVQESALTRSSATGPGACIALDRRILARCLSLGCHSLRGINDRPLVAEGPNRTVLAAVLDSAAIVPAPKSVLRTAADAVAIPRSPLFLHHWRIVAAAKAAVS